MAEKRETELLSQRYVYLVPKQPDLVESSADVSLQDLWQSVWAGRRIVALCALVCLIAGTAYAFLATKWYKADVVLSPASDKSISGGLSSLGGLGDIAGLAGITIPSGRGGVPLAVLKSKSFAREFIEDEKLMPVLFADKWNTQTGDWKVTGPDQPDIRDGVKYFDEKIRIVTEDKKAGLVTLSIEWQSASEASRWANLLVKRLNDRIRSEAIREAETSIGYLQKEMLATGVVSLQQSIGRVLESEMQKMALARANEEFAFKVVDNAFPPKRRVSPQRTLIVATSAVFGAMLGMFYAVISQLWRQKVS
jgi:capsular polysaccharide biosynthesis protein